MVDWDQRFLELASHVATWSKDPSSQVGAVITRDRKVLALGFNGLPPGVDDTPDRLHNRPLKHAMTLHAEANAILSAGHDLRGGTLYCTHPPCSQCAAAAIQAGIETVHTARPDSQFLERWHDSLMLSQTMFAEAGVEFSFN